MRPHHLIAGVAGALLLLVGCGTQHDTVTFAAASTSTCAAPTGTLTNTKRITYLECRVAYLEQQAGVTPTSTPTPSPSVTPKPTVTPSPTHTPTVTPTPSTGFPDATNTGPGGTLATYTGPTTITTAGTSIDSKQINGDLIIKATGVTVDNSSIKGRLISNSGGTVTVTDSLIDGGQQETFPAVSYTGITLERVEVTGGQHSVQCSADCTILDSWLHGQYLPSTSAGHVNAFISNGGSNFVLRHNTLACTVAATQSGGCSGDASLFGDFGQISNATLDHNLFAAAGPAGTGGAYCFYGGSVGSKKYPNANHVVVTNNVFARGSSGKCGIYGPGIYFDSSAAGNQWSGNTWSDGAAVAAP